MIYKNNDHNFSLAILVVYTAAFFLGFQDSVFAAAVDGGAAATPATLGSIFCNAYANTKPFGTRFSYISYVVGACFLVQGIHHLRSHAESPHNHSLRGGLGMLAGAGGLLSMPAVVSTLITSLFTTGGGGSSSCAPGGNGGGGAQLDQMIVGFVTNIKSPLISLVSIIAVVCGTWMMIHGVMKASKYGVDPKSNSINSIIANLLFGAVLMSVGTSLNTVLGSLFGAGVTSNGTTITSDAVTKWKFVSDVGGGAASFGAAVAAALTFFQLIGIIAFVRGLLILKKVVEGGGNASMAQGLTHIVGGALAVNIASFIQIMDATFGTGIIGGS